MRYKDLLTEKIKNKPSNLALYLNNRLKTVNQIVADFNKATELAKKHEYDGASIVRTAMRYASGEDVIPEDIAPDRWQYAYKYPLDALQASLDSYRQHGGDFLKYIMTAIESARNVRPLNRDQQAALDALPHTEWGFREYGFDESPETEADPDFQHAMGYLTALRLGADARARLLVLLDDLEEKIGALWHRYSNRYADKYRPEHDAVETLYHASAFAAEILRDGFKAEKPAGRRGLGNYGEQDGISFTHRYKIAHDLWRALREIWMIAHGKLTAKQIVSWIRAEGIDQEYPNLATTVGISAKVPSPKPPTSSAPAKSDEQNETDHKQALDDTGFWGKKGAGCIVMARDTGRFLIAHRSNEVQEPNTWGTWGGAIDASEDPREAAMRELVEETGFSGSIMADFPLMVFRKNSFAYHNFLFIVDQEFKPKLDWENQGYRWCDWGDWPEPLHFGLQGLLKDPGTQKLISQLIGNDRVRVKKLDELSGPEETVKLYRVYLALSKLRTDPVFTYIEETMEMMKTREEQDIGILACEVRLDQNDQYMDGEAEFRVPADRVTKMKRVL